MAERIQLSRAKGWRMPPNTVRVARPGPWGNPFIVSPTAKPGSRSGASYYCVPTLEDAIACFEERANLPELHEWRVEMRAALAGKNLACFCRLDQPCHADVLLRLANPENTHG